MRLLNADTTPLDETVVTIEYWYDRKTRSWVVQTKTKEGFQVGEADYVGTRPQAESIAKNHQIYYPEAKIVKT